MKTLDENTITDPDKLARFYVGRKAGSPPDHHTGARLRLTRFL